MKHLGAILLLILFTGCAKPTDYSAYADKNRPMLGRIASLDARLRGLLGEAQPDSTRVLRILDSLSEAMGPRSGTQSDSALARTISTIFVKIGIKPVLEPQDSDLIPSLAWQRRQGGCVPLALFWSEMLKRQGHQVDFVFLPSHLIVSTGQDKLIETLRQGLFRDRSFYDSTFDLKQRPYYANFRPDSGALLASMLIQAGLLEWKTLHSTKQAELAFRAATKICPGLPEAEGNLGLVLEEQRNETEAIEHLQIAVNGDRLANAAKIRLKRLKNKREIR